MKIYFMFIFCFQLNQLLASKVLKRSNTCLYGSVSNGVTCDVCGNTSFTPNIRIVGGKQAVPNSWPAQIYLETNIGNSQISASSSCGGTLIDRYTVVTAAHCLVESQQTTGNTPYTISDPLNPSRYKVYVGAHNLSFLDNGLQPSFPTVQIQVKYVIQHPYYDPVTILNDIAILQLAQPVTLNQYVQPACMPNPSYGSYPSSTTILPAYANGWGDLTYGGTSPTELFNVQLNSYPSSYCPSFSESSTQNWNSQICAGSTNGKDTCQGMCEGDSGGGLYTFDSNLNRFVLSGLTSYGNGCGLGPGVYTRISYFLPWIQQNMASGNNISPTPTTTTARPCIGPNIMCSNGYINQAIIQTNILLIILIFTIKVF